jgi:hypothetical protein
MSTTDVKFSYCKFQSKQSGWVYEVSASDGNGRHVIGDVQGVNGNWSYRLTNCLWKWTGGFKTRRDAARVLWELSRQDQPATP